MKNITKRKLAAVILGNLILGIGVAILRFSQMGNDPFCASTMAISGGLRMGLGTYQLILNVVLFVFQLLWGRSYIGLGTIINAFFLGYFVTFFYTILTIFTQTPDSLLLRILIVLIGVIICSFGLSLYQTADLGVAPYDALSLITKKYLLKVPYFWHRMLDDAVSALVCYLAGGIVGIGTLVTAFGLGPFIHFFNDHFSEKLLKNEKK